VRNLRSQSLLERLDADGVGTTNESPSCRAALAKYSSRIASVTLEVIQVVTAGAALPLEAPERQAAR
jgi:hypothetical protein